MTKGNAMPPRAKIGNRKKRYALNLKATREMRQELERAARASGRSLTQEVEYRLEESFSRSEGMRTAFGGEHQSKLVQALLLAIWLIELESGKSWKTDQDTMQRVQHAASEIVPAIFKGGLSVEDAH